MKHLDRKAVVALTGALASLALACAASNDAPEANPDTNVEASGARADLEAPARAAIERTVPLLQATMETWIREADCISCHHQSLGTMALVMARENGVEIDGAAFQRQIERLVDSTPGDTLYGDGGANGTFGRGYQLVALAAAGVPRDHGLEALAYYLEGNATRSPRAADETFWASFSFRPPLEASPVTGTAFAVRALDVYHPDARSERVDATIERAVRHLERRVGRDAEERAMRVLGLLWGGAPASAIRAAAADVLAAQRDDGGWAQLATLESDAYATGQALTILHQAGVLTRDDDAFRRGVEFLLARQLDDGSWLVETRRRVPGLPYFETGFPHRVHQFISTAATAWATMALACALTDEPSAAFHAPRPPSAREQRDLGLAPIHLAAAFGSIRELEAALDAGGDPNAVGTQGLRPLHLAVHDARATALLLERGVAVDARTEDGVTPLMLAAWFGESDDAARALLAAGADPVARAESDGRTPLLSAVASAKRALVRELLRRGANVDEPDATGMTPLHQATTAGDAATARVLLEAGADVDARCEGAAPLHWAAQDGEVEVASVLLAAGADPDAREPDGMTPLAWAAKVDHGHRELLDVLLRAGADPSLATDGETLRTPADWARFFDNELALEVLAPDDEAVGR